MLCTLIVSLIMILFLYDYLLRKYKSNQLKGITGPPSLPIIGNLLIYRGQTPEGIMDFILSNRNKYGRLYRVWILNQLAVFSCDPRDLEVILSKPHHITKNNLYNLLKIWLGDGLLVSTGKKWHSRRKIITPTFHFKILEQFVEIFDQKSAILIEKLKINADGKTPINIFPSICLTTLDIIAETAMGTEINAQLNPDIPYVQAVTRVTNIMTKRFIQVWPRIDWLFRLFQPDMAKQCDAAIKLMHDFTENIITERRQALEAKLNAELGSGAKTEFDSSSTTKVLGEKPRIAFLDVLLQASVNGQPLSNQDIREEVDTFMFEGHDTTTSGISFCLYEISRHPEVQAKLFAELRSVVGDDLKHNVTIRDLGELKYMECVIKESLRLYPPVPIIGRYLDENIEIRGRRIPSGTNYTIGIYAILRDPEFFPDPHSFKPERFQQDVEVMKINPYAYIPFSAGPRNCVGQKFAILEMKSTISKILRHFELLPLGPTAKPMMNLVLRSATGMHLGLKIRSYH